MNLIHYCLYDIPYPGEELSTIKVFIFYGLAGIIVSIIIGLITWFEAVRHIGSSEEAQS